MSAGGERSMTFQASTEEGIAAVEEAARRAGMQHLSADRASGVLVFTAGRMVLAFGEKVTARILAVAPGIVQVTLSSNLQFGMGSASAQGSIGRSLNRIAASKRYRRMGCSVSSAARSGVVQSVMKSAVLARIARYSGRYRPA